MTGLLDTHILLWWFTDDRRLSRAARDILQQSSGTFYVSVASLWEIVIKTGKGLLELDLPELQDRIEADGFLMLPVQAAHVMALARLPAHHHDPFDRILVAQAISEGTRLITADRRLARYGEVVLAV